MKRVKCLTRKKLLFIIAILLILILLIEKMNELTPYPPFISDVILIVTAGILLWYAFETYLLRKQSVLQTEIQIRPLLIVIFDKKMSCIIAKNIGNGIALNVETEIIPIRKDSEAALVGIKKLSFDKIDAIPGKEEMKMHINDFGDNKANKYFLNEEFALMELANFDYEFRVKYENINEEKYQTVGTTGKDGVRIKDIGKV